MTNKLVYFIGNWKMFGDLTSIKVIKNVEKFYNGFTKYKKKNKIVFCVPDTLINFLTKNLKSKHISIGAQDCHHYSDYGAFTGSVNASMIKNLQCLRAFAAINVVYFHTLLASESYGKSVSIFSIIGTWGQNGVDIFFVLSGFVMIHTQIQNP